MNRERKEKDDENSEEHFSNAVHGVESDWLADENMACAIAEAQRQCVTAAH
jgi:hypothetical protein